MVASRLNIPVALWFHFTVNNYIGSKLTTLNHCWLQGVFNDMGNLVCTRNRMQLKLSKQFSAIIWDLCDREDLVVFSTYHQTYINICILLLFIFIEILKNHQTVDYRNMYCLCFFHFPPAQTNSHAVVTLSTQRYLNLNNERKFS